MKRAAPLVDCTVFCAGKLLVVIVLMGSFFFFFLFFLLCFYHCLLFHALDFLVCVLCVCVCVCVCVCTCVCVCVCVHLNMCAFDLHMQFLGVNDGVFYSDQQFFV